MRERLDKFFRPDLERLEPKQPLSAGAATAHVAITKANSQAKAPQSVSPAAKQPTQGYLVYRITNPNAFNNRLTPPFGQVLVQASQPVAGQTYNVLYVTVRNGTTLTFDASSGFEVKFPGQRSYTPILTGNQQWKPGQNYIFYVLTKKYYPLPSEIADGFEFKLAGAPSVAIPGPSGIFLRLTYKPATFAKVLDSIVSFGVGAQGGQGVKTGIADTALYEFVSAKTKRIDFGGYF
jgi:hypothetical protein